MGKPQYGAVHEMDDDQEFYKYALGITRSIPSEETLRQITDEPLPIRLDFENGASENIGILIEGGCHFIIKRNLRRESRDGWFEMAKENSKSVSAPWDGKTVYIGSGWKPVTYQTQSGGEKTATVRTGYEIIENYHAHGECEQFHSEIKTDMDVERLTSGKLETNELVLELTILAYNILRMIGQETIGRRGTKTKHKVRRRRLRTVTGNMIMMASHVTKHAHQLIMGLGKSNIWRYAFAETYLAFADFRL